MITAAFFLFLQLWADLPPEPVRLPPLEWRYEPQPWQGKRRRSQR